MVVIGTLVVEMFLVCHVILRDHVIKKFFLWLGAPHTSHQLAKFGGHRHCGSGNMFLVVEEQDSTCSLKSAITVFSQVHNMKAHGM